MVLDITDTALKASIDAELEPRVRDQEAYIAYARHPSFLLESANSLYVRNQYHQQFLDFTSGGTGVLPVGHVNDAVKTRIFEQLNHYGRVGPPPLYVQRWPVEYARDLVATLPNPKATPLQVLYCDSGQAAILIAEKLAFAASGRPHFLVNYIDADGTVAHPDELAGKAIQTRMDGGLVISNESVLGYGRTGRLWAQERWNVDADITVLGSIGGGGFPFGAVVASPEHFTAAIDQIQISLSAGHPAICAAGHATLSQIDTPLLLHVEEAAGVLNTALQGLCTQFFDVLEKTSGVGMNHFLTFHRRDVAKAFPARAREAGVLVNPAADRVVELTPALVISELELQRGVDLLADALTGWDPVSD